MSRILYWLVIKPISLLPHFLLYGVSDFLFVVIYYVVGYRKKVVYDNIRRSFPEKSEREVISIARKFYRHFCDLVVESLKNFSVTQQQAAKRLKHLNPEIFLPFFDKSQSVIIAGGHYGNWELWAVTVADVIPHKVVAIYKRLSNRYFDSKMRSSRGKFGLGLVATKETGDHLRLNTDVEAMVFAIDQSPSNPKKCLWINFLGRETAALFGTEKYAVMYNRPVIFGHLRKVRRGHYEAWYEVITDDAASLGEGYLTQHMHDVLEKDIRECPEHWLWSHKRWKHRKPGESADIQAGVS